jgi:tetratricopeptide (TPR) repeat protein
MDLWQKIKSNRRFEMKNVFFILFLIFPLCYAQTQKSSTIPSDYDSLKVVISDLDKRQKEIENSIDSLNGKFLSDKFITIDVLEKAQIFYNSSFDKIQSSYTTFITIIVGFVTFLTGFLIFVNFKHSNEIKEINDKAKGLDEKIKEHDKSISDFKKNMDVFMENKENLKDEEKRELKEMAEYVKNNPNASEYEKALAGAATCYYDNNYKSALESYKTILKNYRDKITLTRLPQIYFQMAYSYTKIAQSGENKDKENMLLKAIDKYNLALELDSKYMIAYNNLGNTLTRLAELKTETKEKEGLLLKAIDKYNLALELDSKYAMVYYSLGNTLISSAKLKAETKEKEDLLNKAEEVCLKSRDLDYKIYNLACVYAIKYSLTKKSEYEDLAFKYLEKSLEKKEQSFDYAENDSDFASLNKDDTRYKKLKEMYGKK